MNKRYKFPTQQEAKQRRIRFYENQKEQKEKLKPKRIKRTDYFFGGSEYKNAVCTISYEIKPYGQVYGMTPVEIKIFQKGEYITSYHMMREELKEIKTPYIKSIIKII